MQKHLPVLLNETITALDLKNGDTVVDCTLGDGGYARELASRIGDNGLLIAVDLDEANVETFNQLKIPNAKAITENFRNIDGIIKKFGLKQVGKIVADLGFSSRQLDTVPGLSFQKDSPLDMRMSLVQELTAADIVNSYSVEKLVDIFEKYGEERRARRIAEAIVQGRKKKKIAVTQELVGIVRECYGGRERKSGINVATKVFMALRIAVNDELGNLEELLVKSLSCLRPGGRIAIISFHSLEDRMVKNFFRREAKSCICEDEMRCNCDHQPQLRILTKHPIKAGEEELSANPRSRSARLRVAEKF